jgi:hypothetical protein
MGRGDGFVYLFHPDDAIDAHANVAAFALADALDLLALGLLAALVVAGWRVLPRTLWLYSAALAVVPVLFSSRQMALAGLTRYFLAAFPLFVVLAVWLRRGRLRAPLWLAGSAVLGGYLTAFFTTWRWVA